MNLAWDPPEPATDVTAYTIYYGGASGVYTNSVKQGTACQSVVSGLVEGATYFFTVTASNQAGLESKASNEISYTVPNTTGMAPPTPPVPSLSLTNVIVIQTNLATGTRTVELQGTLSPNGSDTQIWAEYGVASNLAQLGPLTFSAGFNNYDLRLAILGLLPGTSYTFRLFGTNAAGNGSSQTLSFTIPTPFVLGDANGDGIVDFNELNLVVSNYFNPTAAGATNIGGLRAVSLSPTPENAISIGFSLLVSTNLADWLLLPGRGEFWDLGMTNPGPRYYRLRSP